MAGTEELRIVPVPACGFASRANGDSLELESPRHRRRVLLNPPAQAILDLCDGRRSVSDIRVTLEARLAVPNGSLERDVRRTIEELAEASVLRLKRSSKPQLDGADIDWERVAEPQADTYDLHVAARLWERSRRRNQELQSKGAAGPSLFGGRVRVEHVFERIPADLRPAALDHPNLARAEELLSVWSLGRRGFELVIDRMHPLHEPAVEERAATIFPGGRSQSKKEHRGAMWATVDCPFQLAECFLAELAHQKLFALGLYKSAARRLLSKSEKGLYPSSVFKKGVQPMSAVVHGLYAALYAACWHAELLERGELGDEERDALRARFERRLCGARKDLAELQTGARTTPEGESFFAGLADWAERIYERADSLLGGRGAVAWPWCSFRPATAPAEVAPPPARNPSARYRELVALYAEMHVRTGDATTSVAAGEVFRGQTLWMHARRIKSLIVNIGASSLLDYGSGKGWQYSELALLCGEMADRLRKLLRGLGTDATSILGYWEVERPYCYDPCYPPFSVLPRSSFDGVVCTDVLEHCPEDDVDWILAELFSHARHFVFASVSCHAAVKTLPNGENAHCTVRPPTWWAERVHAAARAFPDVRYHVQLESDSARG